MNKELFIEEVHKLGIELDDDKLSKLEEFYKLLIEWNEKINLTAITNKEDVYLKHFYDSLTLYKEVDLNKNITLCDVGSGAGFPGIVLKIVFPELKITLIDSLQKRVNYLNEVIKALELKDIEAYHYRMEDYSRENPEKFDIITARAVASTKLLCEISVRSLKIGGRIVLMKANVDEELDNIDNMLKELSLEKIGVNKFMLPIENSNRALVSFKKVDKTKDKYPRNIDKIKKNSL
jgi:16S rRNA (guanine527-N7)-methyltransferase